MKKRDILIYLEDIFESAELIEEYIMYVSGCELIRNSVVKYSLTTSFNGKMYKTSHYNNWNLEL
jgi:uncharacterized protein with HEPN domain